jgi:hypothetical protein
MRPARSAQLSACPIAQEMATTKSCDHRLENSAGRIAFGLLSDRRATERVSNAEIGGVCVKLDDMLSEVAERVEKDNPTRKSNKYDRKATAGALSPLNPDSE